MLLRFARRTMMIQLLLWVAIVLGSMYVATAIVFGSAWLEAAKQCSQSAMHFHSGEAYAQQFASLALFAFGAIFALSFLTFVFGAYRELKKNKNKRIPHLSFAETMVHLSMLVGGLGLILGILS